jgi:hypothetical protein
LPEAEVVGGGLKVAGEGEETTDVIPLEQVRQIILPVSRWQEIVGHCRRKLAGRYVEGESRMPRAYGLVAGTQDDRILKVERILPIKRNVRHQEPYKTYMDGIMKQYAVPSKTPFSKRGWITDPEELKACYDQCDQQGLMVFGSYHVHLVPWEHDSLRDGPTHLDTVLARNSRLFSFIVSMVDITRPRMRAFYEASEEKEVQAIIEEKELAEIA